MAEETSISSNVQTAPAAGQASHGRPSLKELAQQADEEKQGGNRTGKKEEDNGNRTQGREKTDRVAITEEARKASQAAEAGKRDQQLEARVQARAEARAEERQRTERGAERGAAQKLENLEEDNARGVRGLAEPAGEETSNQAKDGGQPSLRDLTDTSGAADRFGKTSSGLDSDRDLTQEAQDKVLPERADRPNVVEAVNQNEEQKAAAEAAKEPVLETTDHSSKAQSTDGSPSANAVQDSKGKQDVEQSKNEGEQQQQASPAAVETEIGQNVDRLI